MQFEAINMKYIQRRSTRLLWRQMTTKELSWMMEFRHWLLEIKFWLKMPKVIAKIIKVLEIFIAMIKTLKDKISKKPTDENHQ